MYNNEGNKQKQKKTNLLMEGIKKLPNTDSTDAFLWIIHKYVGSNLNLIVR